MIARKIGMTRIYEGNKVYAVTVLKIESTVVQHKTIERDGYQASVLLYGNKKFKKPQKYIYDKFQVQGYMREFRDEYAIGETLSVELFAVGQKVNVRGISKGKGFAGTMKRHNFSGGRASHGASKSHRSAGSTGQCQDAGKVFKNKKMAGHLGSEKVSIKNLLILRINIEENLLLVHGAVPGSNNSYIEVRKCL